MTELRSRAALAYAAQRPPGWEKLLAQIESWAERLSPEQPHWTVPLAAAQLAGIAMIRGDSSTAQRLLGEAAARFDSAVMPLNAAAIRWTLGMLRGGPHGELLVREAERWMRGEGIADPERMSRALVPGFA